MGVISVLIVIGSVVIITLPAWICQIADIKKNKKGGDKVGEEESIQLLLGRGNKKTGKY